MNIETKIVDWFDQTGGGGLVLPNGWFGRPYDNIHQLDSVAVNDDGLVIVLDGGQLTLSFEGVPKIEITRSDIIFSSFRRIVFDWKEYFSMKSHSENHEGGEVKIVAPLGE
jgi:hypothetical protein